MTKSKVPQVDVLWVLGLVLPLSVRLFQESGVPYLSRLALFGLAFLVVLVLATLFRRRRPTIVGGGFFSFAILFAVMVPGPVGWGSAVIAFVFGWIFSIEIFNGKPLLSPALLALAFAIFSFPAGGFEAVGVLASPPDPLLAVSCIPGAALLFIRKQMAWQIVAAALAGAAAAAFLMSGPSDPHWWQHYFIGTFPIGVLFLSVLSECVPRTHFGRWSYGVTIGGLIVVSRLFNPDQPDGVVFALLFAGLFAPLFDRIGARGAQLG